MDADGEKSITVNVRGVGGDGALTGVRIFETDSSGREVRSLVTDGTLSHEFRGPRIFREIHQDLLEMAKRQREITRQIADEDFSLRAILASLVEGVLIADGNMRIRLTNDRLQQMFSLPKPPVDRTVMEVFRNHLLHQIIQQTLDTEEPRSTEL